MSENVLSYGFMAALKEPIKAGSEIDEFREDLYDTSELRANYEGTLIYIDFGGTDEACGGMFFQSANNLTVFHNALAEKGIEITHEILGYSSVWYNGTDSYMDELKLKDFLKGLE